MLTRRASLTAGLASGLTLTAPTLAETSAVLAAGRQHDVRAFGAKGDRHSLDDDPFARTIAAALADDQYPGSILIPAGHYRRARSIALPDHVVLRGEGHSSVLNSQNDTAFVAPILTNATGAAIGWRLADLSLFGGSHGLKLDIKSEAANLRFDDVAMLMQSTANIEVNKLFQTSKFFGGVLGSAPFGLKVDGRTTNAFNSFGLEWTDHSTCSMYLRGAAVVLVVGGRFEGGGRAGNATIDIEDGASITFIGVYFENVHEYLARLKRVKILSFVNCHFTGTHANSPATLSPFKWDIDSNILIFRDCHSSLPMPVPGNVLLDGANVNIFPTHAVHEMHGLHGRIVAAPRRLRSAGSVDLLSLIAGSAGTGRDGVFDCELSLTVADATGSSRIARWRGSFEIVEKDGMCRIDPPTPGRVDIGQTSIDLILGADGRLVARYRHAGGQDSHLSWTIGWHRVAGDAQSSLAMYVP